MQAKKRPERMCIACRECKDKNELIRIVKTKEGEILLDETGKHSGRGAYICDRMECFQKACKSHALDRSFKMEIPSEVYEELERRWKND
ncbi:MAG: YlxR family protein [Eubacterium sp.]|nr:YlxR family protein [Eubacterium sp.]